MGCSSCGKKRTRPGAARSAPLRIGDRSDDPILRVRVTAGGAERGIIPGSGKGSVRYVFGSGASQAVEDGLLEKIAELPRRRYRPVSGIVGRLYCVGEGSQEICFQNALEAQERADAIGVDVREKEGSAT